MILYKLELNLPIILVYFAPKVWLYLIQDIYECVEMTGAM